MIKIQIQIRRDLDLLKETMDQLIDDVINRNRIFLIRSDRGWVPAVDVYETNNEVLVVAELPYVDVNNIQITLGNEHMRIRGNRPDIAPKMKIHQMEIDFGKFERTVKLPVKVSETECSAVYSEGFLTIKLKKL